MELDWSTFALEILNFLVLVWLLKRLLYKPVLNAIAKRKAEIQRSLSDAGTMRQEAQTLREQYEHRQAGWNEEKEKARNQMLEEVAAERTRLLAALRSSLEQEREKTKALEERRLNELTRQVEDAAIAQGGQFATRLLSRFASPELEARLVELVIEDLRRLSEERRQAIRTACAKADIAVIVSSAHALNQSQRQSLQETFESLSGRAIPCEWREDAHLLAGIRLSLGPWMLGANLQDELKFFTEALRPVSPTHAS
ncbi:F0F1 ATP synthase subunit delta [Nitrospira sp. NS4]|uniref:F0F1 ATP synthase subunit delta n=1 Tax=Nitrospira sp. NS4 TaxID=3414498 RepID=UPI003C2BA730